MLPSLARASGSRTTVPGDCHDPRRAPPPGRRRRRPGRRALRRDAIRRLYRWQGADTVYLGPNGLAGWDGPDVASQWGDEGGRPFTDKPGATLAAALGVPEKAVIEVELSWTKKPDFVLA